MKRKVRIYKDPNGQGGYINKTAQWLRKAQEGAETGITPVTAGIMQQMQSSQPQQMMQQQQQQDPREQILAMVVQLNNKGYGQDDIKDYLLTNVYGLDKNSEEYSQYEPQILEFVAAVVEKLRPEVEEEEQEQEISNDFNSDLITEASADKITEDDQNDQMINDIIYDDNEARYGGTPNKRSYINKIVRKLKKAQEGDQVEEANTANVRGTENNPTTDSPGNKNPFIAGVKEQAENHFLKKQAEEMYNNQFGQEMPEQQDNMNFAQFGGWRMRRANRAAFGTPFVPPGASAKYKFGLLGGLRSAEVQFNPLMMSSMFPMMTFPGMGGYSGFGYNQPYRKISKGRLVTERIAATVNNESIIDVANATNSEAAVNATPGPCTEDQVKDPKSPCYDPMYAGHGPVAPQNNTDPISGGTGGGGTGGGGTGGGGTGGGGTGGGGTGGGGGSKIKKDKWGRPEGDKWYGFDPDTKQWTLKDQWGRSSNDIWYGFNPDTKQYTLAKTPPKQRWNNVTEKRDSWGRPESDPWYGYNAKQKKFTEGYNKGSTGSEHDAFLKQMQEYEEYNEWNKNANDWDRLAQQFEFGPQNPNHITGLNPGNPKDYLTDFLPTGLGNKGVQAIKLLNAPAKALKQTGSLGDDAINFTWKNLYKNPNLLQQGTKGIGYTKGLPYTKALPAPYGTQLKLVFPPYAYGGFVDNPMQDQLGNLQKFIYGDQVDDQMLEDLYQPPINQSDLYYTDSKDTTDAYFRHGGLLKADGGYEVIGDPKKISGVDQNFQSPVFQRYNQNATSESNYKAFLEMQNRGLVQGSYDPTKTYDMSNNYNSDRTIDTGFNENQGQYNYPGGYPGGYGGGYNPYDSYSAWGSRGNYGGFGPMASTGLLGSFGNLIKGFGRGPSKYSPVGNPLQYAATAAMITNSGMLPTGMRYSKEKGRGLLGKLGLRNDRVWTLDYATPDQIKAGTIPGTAGVNNIEKEKERKVSGITITNVEGNTAKGIDSKGRLVSGDFNDDEKINRKDRRYQRRHGIEDEALEPDMSATRFQGPDMSNMQDIEDEQNPSNNGVPPLLQRPDVSQALDQNPMNAQSPKSVWDPNNIVPNTSASNAPQSNLGPVGMKSSQPILQPISGSGLINNPLLNPKQNLYNEYFNKSNVVDGAPYNTAGPMNTMDEEMAYGGYVPAYMAYGGYLPTADNGINFSSISYAGNPVIGVEESPTWAAMNYFNNQNQNIKNPDADKFKNYTIEPEGDDLSDCTYEQKLDPTSKCYEPQTAQLKIKEEKGKMDPTKLSRGVLDFGANLADAKDYMNERRTKYIPGMTEFATSEKQSANEDVKRGSWNIKSGKEGDPQSFKGVISRKGGVIKSKKSKSVGHKINISDFQDLMRLAGLK